MEPSSEIIEITIQSLTGKKMNLLVSSTETIQELKERINRIEDVPTAHQHLVWRGQELNNHCTLAHYGIESLSTISLVLSLRGGPISTKRIQLDEPKISEMMDYLAEIEDTLSTSSSSSSCSESGKKRVAVVVCQRGDKLSFYRLLDANSPAASSDGKLPEKKASSLLLKFGDLKRMKERMNENGKTKNKMDKLKIQMKKLHNKKNKVEGETEQKESVIDEEKKTQEVVKSDEEDEQEENEEEEDGPIYITPPKSYLKHLNRSSLMQRLNNKITPDHHPPPTLNFPPPTKSNLLPSIKPDFEKRMFEKSENLTKNVLDIEKKFKNSRSYVHKILSKYPKPPPTLAPLKPCDPPNTSTSTNEKMRKDFMKEFYVNLAQDVREWEVFYKKIMMMKEKYNSFLQKEIANGRLTNRQASPLHRNKSQSPDLVLSSLGKKVAREGSITEFKVASPSIETRHPNDKYFRNIYPVLPPINVTNQAVEPMSSESTLSSNISDESAISSPTFETFNSYSYADFKNECDLGNYVEEDEDDEDKDDDYMYDDDDPLELDRQDDSPDLETCRSEIQQLLYHKVGPSLFERGDLDEKMDPLSKENKSKKPDKTFDLLLPPITRQPKTNQSSSNVDLVLKKNTLLPPLQRTNHNDPTKLPSIIQQKQDTQSKQQEIQHNQQQQKETEKIENKDEAEKVMRCHVCRKRTPLATAFLCRCDRNFCAKHRYPECHKCTYDYKIEGRKALKEKTPLIAAAKLPKI